MTDENSLKLKYINENILEKGYNPEELSSYVIRTLNRPLESISLDQLKDVIEEFKVQRLQETYLNMQTAAEDEKKTIPLPEDPYYSPAVYEIKTLSQQENTLLKLDQEKKMIQITVSDPKIEKKGKFFSKVQFTTYRVTCTEIDSDVRRSYSDFEWLKKNLVEYYSLRQIPPIIKEQQFFQGDIVNNKSNSEDEIEEIKIKYLNYFMNRITQKKILRTSPLLYEFLELGDEDFKKYKELLGKYKFELNVSFDNFKTTKGSIHCELKPDDVKSGELLNKKYLNLADIYRNLEKNINGIANDFQDIENRMKEVGDAFNKLNMELTLIDNEEKEKPNKLLKIYNHLNNMFMNWSSSYGKQSKFFREDFRHIFNYMGLEMLEMDHIYKKYINYKKEYEDFTNKLNKKKEFLFAQKDYKKWNVLPGTEDQISKYLTNKKLAFEKMLYQENEVVSEEKKRVACTLHIMNKQFNKLLKHQGDNMEKYWETLKVKNQDIIGDAFNLVKFFSMKVEEE